MTLHVDCVRGCNDADRHCDLRCDGLIAGIPEDAKPIDPAPVPTDSSVAEILAEQVRVCRLLIRV